MAALRTIASLSWTERRLLAEAALILLVAAACVAFVPFRVLGRFLAGEPVEEPSPADENETIQAVRWAVRAIARRAPFRARCFEQGLAAVWMLRRRGVAGTLHYGLAKRTHEELVAHVWVTSRKRNVIGCENKDEFHEFVRFPEALEPGELTARTLRRPR